VTDRSELLGDRGSLPDSHLFTVRLWPEALGPGSVEWRNKVTHVLSGETRYFREWQTFLDFLVSEPKKQSVLSRQAANQDHTNTLGEYHVDEEYAQRHCLMVSQDAGEGTSGSALIWYLDWLDAQGVPHSQGVVSHYAGFKLLGDDGWKLVQVIEVPGSIGMDGPVPATTEFYFTRPARSKG
jgi:hypothetical protein